MKQKVQSFKTAIGLYLSAEQKYSANPTFKNNVNYTKAYLKNNIKDNVILYETMHGTSMTDTPYAMFQKLLKMEDKNFIHVWAIKDASEFDTKGYEKYKNVIFVEVHSPKYMYYLTSAKYLINNNTFPPYFIKKEGQIYLNTWHGTPLKTLGKDMKGMPSQHKNIQRNFLQSDYLMAPNAYTANILVNSHNIRGIYSGKIIEEGYPRIDATFNTNKDAFLTDVLGQAINIDPRKKIILYAPTWRGAVGASVDITKDLTAIIKKITEQLPKTHQLILKVHPLVYHFLENAPKLQKICVPESIDTNELLAAVDVLITDYSSIFFDFYVTRKPIILFAYDYNEYMAGRGMYLDINKLDVQVAFTMDTFVPLLLKTIKQKKAPDYQEAIQKYCYKNLDGTTTDRYIDIIFNRNETDYNVYSVKNAKKNIIIYGGGMLNNGVTSSLINLTNTLDYDKFNLILIEKDNLSNENINNMKKLNDKVKILYRTGEINAIIPEWTFYMYSLRKYNESYLTRFNIIGIYQREFKRLFGGIQADIIIDYSGYIPFWAQLFAYSKVPTKIIYQHNDMWEESQKIIGNRFKHRTNLEIIFRLYHKFDVIACVGEKTMEANIKNLKKFVSRDKFHYIPNSLDASSILKKVEAFEYADVKILDRDYLLNISEANHFVSGFLAPRKDSKIFITIGRLSPEKDQMKLIEAFKKLFNDRPEYQNKVQLYIIGTGTLQNELQQKVNDYGLSEHIILTGQLDNPFPLMKKSNCYISSSNHEGQPMVLLEALVLKKDIIATNIEGNVSVLGDNYGKLVNNSIDGLYGGIVDYLGKQFTKAATFDVAAYERQVKQTFEDICLATYGPNNMKERVQ